MRHKRSMEMGTVVGVGCSINRDSAQAGREAALQALQKGGMSRADFLFVFASVGYQQQVLIDAINEATSGAPLSGCSGEGIITQGMIAETNFCVAVMAITTDEFRFYNRAVATLSQEVVLGGKQMARELNGALQPDSLACFVFADGLAFDFAPLLSAFEKALPEGGKIPFLGGLASDNWTSRKTYQYHNDQVISGGVSLVLLSGQGNIAYGVNHGCVPIGTKRTITRSKANVIYEIDGIPALEALTDYFEEDLKSQWNKMSLNLCLGFKTPEHLRKEYDEYIIRYMMGKDDAQGSVTIQSDVEEGTELWIVRRDKELIRTGLHAISRQIHAQKGDAPPRFALQFECVGRGKVVFREQEKIELIKSLQQEIGPDIPWIGFYTYGEIAPISRVNFFHNFTAVVAVIY